MRKFGIIIGMLWLCVTGCGDSYESSIPSVPFIFSCNLLQSPYFKISGLAGVGQFLKVEKNANGLPVGYAGLIIGQSVHSDGNTYIAYDAACPVEASRSVSVEVQEDGLGTAVCPKCHTEYDLSGGGFPVTGEGTEYLKHYKVSVSGTTLLVRN